MSPGSVRSHAALTVLLAVFLPAALGGIDRLVDRGYHVGDRDRVGAARQMVAAARPTDALNEPRAPEFAEELLQVRQRNLLPVRNAGERHGALGPVHRDVDHGRNRETSFGSESHGGSVRIG